MKSKIIAPIAFIVISSLAYGQALPVKTAALLKENKQENPAKQNEEPKKFSISPEKAININFSPQIFNDSESNKSENENKQSDSGWRSIDPNWVTAIATILLFIYTRRLWSATIKMVNNTREDAQTELRAYIHFMRVEIDDNAIKVVIKNSGKTPAIDFIFNSYEFKFYDGENDVSDMIRKGNWAGIKNTKNIFSAESSFNLCEPINIDKYNSIHDKKITISCDATYNDVFKNPHPFKISKIGQIRNGVLIFYDGDGPNEAT